MVRSWVAIVGMAFAIGCGGTNGSGAMNGSGGTSSNSSGGATGSDPGSGGTAGADQAGSGGVVFGSGGSGGSNDAGRSDARDIAADSEGKEVLDTGRDANSPADLTSPPHDGGVEVMVDSGTGAPPSRLAIVQIEDAIIGPGKLDGTAWDSSVMIPQAVLRDLGTALAGGDPVGGSLAVLAGPTLNAAISSVDKPDAYGSAQLTVYGQVVDESWLAAPADDIRDSYTPIWPYDWHYQNIPIDTDVRIRITLWDKDLIYDDPIGVAEINSADLKAALADHRKHYVRVDDQTGKQILFIGISVVIAG